MTNTTIPLFNQYNFLKDKIPWVKLIDHNTPIEQLSNLEKELDEEEEQEYY